MKKTKKKRIKLWELMACLMQQVFLHTVGSWGAFVVDENGNFIEDENIYEESRREIEN